MEECLADKEQLVKLLRDGVLNNKFDNFINKAKPLLADDLDDEKTLIELTFREVLLEFIAKKSEISLLERIFQFSIDAALQDIALGNLPVLVIGDMFEASTLSECEAMFAFLEKRVETFKKEIFFKQCKINLLRSCNDLLRRLSRSQNTVFCGRILLFLAHLFPLSERSGLNIISEFNLDNTTTYCTNDDAFSDITSEVDDDSEEGEIGNNQSPLMIDKNMYQKFWSLQDFFRSPNNCYNKIQWRHFINCTNDILTAFGNFKSDDPTSSKWKQVELPLSSGSSVYFAKYLTSPKLLKLELSDSNFRRYLLVQFLILFQYLSLPVKFKLEAYQLSEEQQAWVKETTKKIYKLLEATPPNGATFCENVKKILAREEYWNAWKNEGCPDFKFTDEKVDSDRGKKRPRDDLPMHSTKIHVGSAELTKLWNICPDNWEACRSPKRNFVPSLESFFGIGKSEGGYLNQKRDLSNPKFEWKALRLLSMKSPHFFTVSTNPQKNVQEYLEVMAQKLAKERPINQQPELSTEIESATATEDSIEDGNDEILHTSEEESKDDVSLKNVLLSKSEIEILSEKLKQVWQVLATHLGFKDSEIESIEQSFLKSDSQAEHMLTTWMKQSPDADMATLKNALKNVGLLNVVLPFLNIDDE